LSFDELFRQARPILQSGQVIKSKICYRTDKNQAIALTDYGEIILVKNGASKLGSAVLLSIKSHTKHGHGNVYHGSIVN